MHKLTSESESSHTSSGDSEDSNSEHHTEVNQNESSGQPAAPPDLAAMKRIRTTVFNEPMASSRKRSTNQQASEAAVTLTSDRDINNTELSLVAPSDNLSSTDLGPSKVETLSPANTAQSARASLRRKHQSTRVEPATAAQL